MQPKEKKRKLCVTMELFSTYIVRKTRTSMLIIQYYFFLDIRTHKLVRLDASGKRNLGVKEKKVLDSHFLFVLFEFYIIYMYNLS